ncbi:MAG: FG-GAP repeat protein, partial [Alteromonadaceae bacterium]|nr:FG-GAP repeat protein [Alteromonadaceae bacterium]
MDNFLRKKILPLLNKLFNTLFILLFVGATTFNVSSATVGLPFTENFSTQTLMDASKTTANWSTNEQAALLADAIAAVLDNGGFTLDSNLGSETDETRSITLGDVDGDGDLDLVVGNFNQTNKLYMNDGSG